ncbi:MAG: hypothetical protein RLZZ440_817 [Planctomycetota bacterium]
MERRPRRRFGVFSLAALAVLGAAAWLAPAVAVHTSLRDRPLEAVFAGIEGRVASAAATWNWLSGIEYRNLTLTDPAGRPAVLVESLLIEKGILGLLASPTNLGTVRLSGVEAVVAVRPGGSSLEDILAGWLARGQAGGGVACEFELVDATVELVDTRRSEAWRCSDLIAAGTLEPDGRLAGWTLAGRLAHVGIPAAVTSGGSPSDPVTATTAPAHRLDRTTIPAAAATALARDGGWTISSPAVAAATPRPLAVTAHRVPLGVSSVAATRFGLPRLVDGLADIRLDMTFGPAGHDLGGRIVIDGLAVCRADTLAEEVRVDHCELPFDLVVSPAGLVSVRELRAVSPVIRAEVSGRLPLPGGDLWAWLDACASHDCGLAAEVDLAAAAKSLPGGLAVRSDVRITGGSLQLGAIARGDGDDRVLELRLDSRNVAAVRTGGEATVAAATSMVPVGAVATGERPLRWSEPLTAWLKGRRGPGPQESLRIEEARITSQAAELSATGTPAAVELQWSVDLGELSGELAEVIDFGGVSLAGRLRGRMDVERAAAGLTAVRTALSITEFELAAPGRAAWKDDTISLDAAVTGRFGLEQSAIESARGMVTAAGDALEATLSGGCVIQPLAILGLGSAAGPAVRPTPGGAAVAAECSLTGEVGQWQRRIGAMLPTLAVNGLELAGRLEASAAVATDAESAGDTWRITRAGGEIERFTLRLGDRQAAEPRIVLTAAGLVSPSAGRLEVSSAELLSSSLSLRSGGLAWEPTVSAAPPEDRWTAVLNRLRGRLQWQADLGRIEPWLVSAAVADRWPISGRAWGTLDIAQAQTGLNLLAEITGSQVVVAERPPRSQEAQPRPVWNEPQATFTIEVTRPFIRSAGGAVSLADRLVVERLAVESSTVAVAARGSVEDLANRRQTTIDGTLSYDWEQLTRLITPWTGGRIRVAGSGGRPFAFRGSLAGPRPRVAVDHGPAASAGQTVPLPESWLTATRGGGDATVRLPAKSAAASAGLGRPFQGMSFDTTAAWTAADLDGFPLAAGDLAIRLVEGQLAFGPFDLAASGGRIRGAPWLELGRLPGELVLPPGRVAERVGLTGVICERFLGWVSPVLAGATHAAGLVTIDTAGGRVPLGDPFAGDLAGQVVFEQLEVRPSGAMQPLVNLLAKLQAVVDPRFTLADQPVLLRVRPEPVRIQLAERRIWHEGLVMDSGPFTVRSQGSVGAEGELAAVVEVALRGDLVGQTPVLAQLMRTPITIPLKGSLARPQFDAGALDLALQRILENTARAVFDDGLGRGIDALFGRPPAPAATQTLPARSPTLSFPR